MQKCNGTCTHKSKYGNLPKNVRFLRQWDVIEDDLFQKDSFNSSDSNSENYSSKKLQESFRKLRQKHPSYF